MTPHIHLPASDKGPRCSFCGEAPHPIGECPACLSPEDTRAKLLITRKALAEAQEELAGWRQAAHNLGVSEPQHLGDVLLTKQSTEDFERILYQPPPTTANAA